jgi:hypothetical protein
VEAAWNLPGICLEATRKLPGSCLKAAWKLLGSCLASLLARLLERAAHAGRKIVEVVGRVELREQAGHRRDGRLARGHCAGARGGGGGQWQQVRAGRGIRAGGGRGCWVAGGTCSSLTRVGLLVRLHVHRDEELPVGPAGVHVREHEVQLLRDLCGVVSMGGVGG